MIAQMDHPLHALRNVREWTGARDGQHYAEGTVNGNYFLIKSGKYDFSPSGTFYPDGLNGRQIHYEAPTYELVRQIVQACVYYEDPSVAFLFASGGPAGLAEVLETAG